jgi:hypothetical protein
MARCATATKPPPQIARAAPPSHSAVRARGAVARLSGSNPCPPSPHSARRCRPITPQRSIAHGRR